MVNYSLSSAFGSLADPTRRDILTRLLPGELPIAKLAGIYNMSLPAVSKHISVLEKAGLIKKQRRGREHFIQLAPIALQDVVAHLQQYESALSSRLGALNAYLSSRAVAITEDATEPQKPQTLAMTQIIDASLETVWEAYVEPASISQWWPPQGTTMKACNNDLRQGGNWRFVIEAADKSIYIFSGTYQQIVPHKRLVYTDGIGGPNRPRPEALVTITFEPTQDGRTKIIKESTASLATFQLNAAFLRAAAVSSFTK